MTHFDYESKIWGGGKVKTSFNYFGASQLRFALADLHKTKGRILEIGCGAGRMAKAVKFYRPDLDVLGIDLSKRAIDEAKRDSQGVKFFPGNVYQLPFKDESFEAVLIFDLLEHLEDPQKALHEVYRVLKPEGILSCFTPIEGNILSIPGLAKRFFGFPGKEKYAGHIQQYTLEDLLGFLKQSHLKFLEKRYFGHLFYQLVDFAYFTFLSLRGKNVPYSVEGYLARERGLKRNLIALVKSMIAVICYLESKVFWFLPASGVHLTAQRFPGGRK
ncbi:hypothetical protein A2Z41_02375 [Microgenomates group bacterium RBG_19FT_COMBO_39_10]|nr:MAG: hypothetical protein A2Z41_02375 [Microgenomates group bacterium RBG_19FT_COMBO_39_10]